VFTPRNLRKYFRLFIMDVRRHDGLARLADYLFCGIAE
jgi:hypothetical protein